MGNKSCRPWFSVLERLDILLHEVEVSAMVVYNVEALQSQSPETYRLHVSNLLSGGAGIILLYSFN